MRKILFGVLGCLVAVCAHAAQVANLDYVHKMIQQKWDISIPIKADNPMLAANMKYLLTAVDVANEILNGEKTTDYGNSEFATLHAADTVATIQAVETLVQKVEKYKFTLTTTPDTSSFSFSISAAGEFVVDWGDGTVETITKPDTTNTTYSHNYDTANTYTIGLSGQATAYSSGRCTWSHCDYTSISFSNNTNLHAVSGSLGEIFGILSDGTMANFSRSFYNCNNLISISDNLFKDGNGQITSDNFMSTFWGCRNLMAIPETLLGNDSSIFTRNSSIGYAFEAMFTGCDALTGPSARINGQYLYEIWPDALYNTWGPYCNASGLSDYSTMPSAWKYCD